MNKFTYKVDRIIYLINLGIGDWGLEIAQYPIPNPQSPIIIINNYTKL